MITNDIIDPRSDDEILNEIDVKNIETVEKLAEKIKLSSALYFTKYTGMNVEQAAELRQSFNDNSVEFLVSKNTLMKVVLY